MTKKQIKKLVLQSYTGRDLDTKKVDKLIAGISRKDLKVYVRVLKNWERKESVDIIIPDEKYKKSLKVPMMKKIFPNKKIRYSTDSTLIAGVRIVNQDMVYDFNLKNTLEDIVEHIKEQYD
ncbi:MAG: hypothetical protein WD967_02690 [Candidatus Levyibacteriota bacterium]